MRKITNFTKLFIYGFLLLFMAAGLNAQAPENFITQAFGAEDLVLRWKLDATVDSYQVEQSTDSVSFTLLGDTQLNKYEVSGLAEGTTYYFRLSAITGGNPVGEVGLRTATITKSMVVDMPLDYLGMGDSIFNVITDSADVLTNGQMTLIDAETSGLGVAATKFLASEVPPVVSYVRLWNTVQGFDASLTERTMSFWFKNESPDKNAVMLTFGKRSGGTIAIKNNVLHGLTAMRHGDVNKWWADSTGVEFSSADWTHVTYIFDHPVTRLYVNGVMVDESDGIGKMDGFSGDTALYWPSPWEMNKPTSGDGKSTEIGCLFEPNAAMVAYLGDTWDAGPHSGYAFNGMMSGVKMYNYALTQEEIAAMIADAPAGLKAQSFGADELAVSWTQGTADAYQVSISTDGSTWEVQDTVTTHYATIEGLSASTMYHIKVAAMVQDAVGGSAVIQTSTIAKRMVVDMPLNELVDGDKIKNILTDSLDVVSNGQVTLVDAASSGLGVAATKFLAAETPPVSSWIRLWNTVQGMDSAFTEKTISFWMKNESPDKSAVPLSFGKRAGVTIAIKDGKLHAFTKMRSGATNKWWVDSTGVEFNSGEWTHVAYIFDNPLTRLYVNGELVDVSDGIGHYDNPSVDTVLMWPSYMGLNKPTNGDGKSAEIGCLFEPCAAMVWYLKDTWDNGAHNSYAFNGMMSGVKMYNYALADDDIKAQYEAYAVSMEKLTVWAHGADNLTLSWNNIEGNTGYTVEQSTDGSTWTDAGTLAADENIITVSGLTQGTEYSFRVVPQGVNGLISNNVVTGSTITPSMLVHLDFAELVGGTGVKNVVTDAVDEGIDGSVTVEAISEDERIELDKTYKFKANTGSITFNHSETPPVTSYVRLSETVMPAGISLNQRTVSVWLKNTDPTRESVALSMGKRTGITFAYKDGAFHAFTKMRPTMSGPWMADSTGTALNSTDWTHITYVYDVPVTKVYINGVLADESDGIFYHDGTKTFEELPFTSGIAINEMSSTNGQSSEIGALFEPCAAMVQYLGGNWDLGARNPFYGSMADLRYYSYALTEQEIGDVMMENLEEAVGTSLNRVMNVEVYPNPTSEFLHFRNAENADIVIIDNAGRAVLSTNLSDRNHVDVSSLSTGIYFIQVSKEDSRETVKVSIIK